jgi:hypothetical protein
MIRSRTHQREYREGREEAKAAKKYEESSCDLCLFASFAVKSLAHCSAVSV